MESDTHRAHFTSDRPIIFYYIVYRYVLTHYVGVFPVLNESCSPTGQCPCPCSYPQDATCTCRDLETPASIRVSKSPLWASYQLNYVQSFNWKPYEAIARTNGSKCLVSCCLCTWAFCGAQACLSITCCNRQLPVP